MPKTEQFTLEYTEKISTLKPKYGLDSGIIVYSIMYPTIYKPQISRVFNREGLFFVHELSLREGMEIKKILVEEYGLSKKDALKEIDNFLKTKKISILSPNNAKMQLAEERMKICKEKGINCHLPDNIIISDFKEFGITKVFSEDGIFVNSSNFLGLPAERILFKLDSNIQKKFGNLPHFKIKEK